MTCKTCRYPMRELKAISITGTANCAARNATGLRCKRLKGNRPLAIREFSLAYDCRPGAIRKCS